MGNGRLRNIARAREYATGGDFFVGTAAPLVAACFCALLFLFLLFPSRKKLRALIERGAVRAALFVLRLDDGGAAKAAALVILRLDGGAVRELLRMDVVFRFEAKRFCFFGFGVGAAEDDNDLGEEDIVSLFSSSYWALLDTELLERLLEIEEVEWMEELHREDEDDNDILDDVDDIPSAIDSMHSPDRSFFSVFVDGGTNTFFFFFSPSSLFLGDSSMICLPDFCFLSLASSILMLRLHM